MCLLLRTSALFMVLCWMTGSLWAQTFSVYDVLYRPPSARYLVLESPHFDVIFQEGLADEGREAAAILEAQLPATQALVGSRRTLRMPVVLNRFNDRSNGYVTAFPFKQEIEGVSIKGNRISARFPSWMWAVTPHELVHASQGESGHGIGVGSLVRWFAPDLARSINLWMPRGMTEGAAVYHESRIHDGAGRLNDARFQMQFRAAMLSDDPWSLAQMLEEPTYDRPANRFYIGGSNFFQYLAAEDNAQFFRRALRLHYRFPFLGHGVELWDATGRTPRQLQRSFRKTIQEQEQARLNALGPLTTPQILATGPGRSYRRPRWLDDATLVAHVTGYDVRTGFYRVDAQTGEQTLIGHHSITEDYYFSLTPDTTALLFARYVPDPLVTIQALAETFRLDLAAGEATQLTEHGRTLAPIATQAGVWGLQNEGQYNQWVQIDATGEITPVSDFERAHFVSLHPHPTDASVAVLLNVRGRQGLFRAEWDPGGTLTWTPWLVFVDASILDADWSADGTYLLFTADPEGIANVFAYDVQQDRVLKLTNVAFGAMEPSLSPDGNTLAFVHYRHERYDLALMPFEPDQAEIIPLAQLTPDSTWAWRDALQASPDTSFSTTQVRPYRAGKYLAPRMLYPTLRHDVTEKRGQNTNLGIGVGVAVQGADPLEKWSYAAEAFFQDERGWGRVNIENGQTLLRPSLTIYDLPETVVAARRDSAGAVAETVRVGREQRGISLGAQVPVVLASNVYTTQARLGLRTIYEQERLFGPDGNTLRDFQNLVRLVPSAVYAHRVQRNLRDLWPNTGTIFSATASAELWREAGMGTRRRAVIAQVSQYLPVSLSHHTGLRLQAGLLSQNRGSIFNLDSFLPRGYEDEFLGEGTFVRLNAEALQPLWFVEDGFVLVPLYVKAFYGYGFAEILFPLNGETRQSQFSTAGAGLGLQFRFFYTLDLDLRVGVSFLMEEGRLETIYR